MSLFEYLTGKKEVITTFSPEVFSRAKAVLDSNKIEYKIKTTFTGSRNRRSGGIGGYGELVNLETQYQIFVSKSKFEEATYVLAKHGRESNKN